MRYYLVLILFFAVTLMSALISESQQLQPVHQTDDRATVDVKPVLDYYIPGEFVPGLGGLLFYDSAKNDFSIYLPLPMAIGLGEFPSMGKLNLNGRIAEDWALPGLGAKNIN